MLMASLLAPMKDLSKYFSAACACSAVLKPTKPKQRVTPSLQDPENIWWTGYGAVCSVQMVCCTHRCAMLFVR